MDAPTRARLVAWLKRLETRGDAWAARRLSPEEFADAVVLDRQLKKNWLRWLGYYGAGIALLALGLAMAKPGLHWGRALLFANVLGACALVFFVSAWYGYRKWTGANARRHFLVFVAMAVLGGLSVIAVDLVVNGRDVRDVAPEKVISLVGLTLLMGMGSVIVLLGIATVRNREARQRESMLRAEAERERLERQSMQAELKLLQAQVEPHFLFNTLANVRRLVQTGSPDAVDMLDHLIHYLRMALPEIRSDGSTLGREAELARAYLEIMKLRMGGALDFAIDVPASLAHASFPPLMLMTLVENAIRHGVGPEGKGRVELRAYDAGGAIHIEVADDGRGLGGEIGQGVGLANVRERLAAIYGDGARLELSARDPAGTCARIEIRA